MWHDCQTWNLTYLTCEGEVITAARQQYGPNVFREVHVGDMVIHSDYQIPEMKELRGVVFGINDPDHDDAMFDVRWDNGERYVHKLDEFQWDPIPAIIEPEEKIYRPKRILVPSPTSSAQTTDAASPVFDDG